MYAKVNVEDLDPMSIDDVEQRLRPVGYELRPSRMRPNVWDFEAGDAGNRHRQREQEELYLVLEGRFAFEADGEREELVPGDVVVVPPATWRRVRALEDGRLFVVGAPNVKDDGVREGEDVG